MNLNDHHYFECLCSSLEHLVRINCDPADQEVYIHVQLKKQSLHNRIFNALRYIFGYQCRYGHWDEVILDRKQIIRLRNLLNKTLGED